MSINTNIEDRLFRAEVKADTEQIPNEGPALYQDRAVYNANIDQNLAAVKEKRASWDAFWNGFDAQERASRLKRKATVGLGVVAASAVLIASNGGPGRVFDGVKSFPQHVATLFEGPFK